MTWVEKEMVTHVWRGWFRFLEFGKFNQQQGLAKRVSLVGEWS